MSIGQVRWRTVPQKLLIILLALSYVIPAFPVPIVNAQTPVSQDWPSYRYDPAGTAYAAEETVLNPPLDLMEEIVLTSTLTTDRPPVIAGDYMLVIEENGLCAYGVDERNLAWCFNDLSGIQISSVADSKVYVYGVLPESDTLYFISLDLAQGTLLKQVSIGLSGNNGLGCSSVVNGQSYCSADYRLVKIDLVTPKIDWIFELDGIGSVPIILGDLVIVGTEFSITAVQTLDGTIAWRTEIFGGITSDPLAFDQTAIMNGIDGITHGLDTSSGEERYRFDPAGENPCNAAYGNGDLIISTSSGMIQRLDPVTGALDWTYYPETLETEFCPTVVMANGFVYFSSPMQNIVALTVDDGLLVWTSPIYGGSASPGLSIANGRLVMPITSNRIAFFGNPKLQITEPQLMDLEETQNPLPVLSGIAPSYAVVGDTTLTTMVITGNGFVSTSRVMWGETELVTTPVSDTELNAMVGTDLLTMAGEVPITVINPEPGGGTSDQAMFQISKILPAQGLKLSTTKVNFDWDDIPGASSYNLQLSLNETFNPLVLNTTVNSSNFNFTSALVNGKTYYWRFRPRFGSTIGQWSSPLHFFSMNPPSAPRLLLPVNGNLSNNSTPTFSWGAVPNAQKFMIQISKNNTFTALVQQVILPDLETSYTIDTLGSGRYYWRVRGIDSVHVLGYWSGYKSFIVDTVAPGVPELYLPKGGGFTNDTMPALSVKAVAGAVRYCYQMRDISSGEVVVNPNCEVQAGTGWAVPTVVGYGEYMWRAKAYDAAGNESGWSVERKLTVTYQNQPKNGAIMTDTTPLFTWTGVAGASGYQLEIAKDPQEAGVAPEAEWVYPAGMALGYELKVGEELVPDNYVWRVRAYTTSDPAEGVVSPWRALTITKIIPTAPLLAFPRSGYVTNTPSLRWIETFNAYAPQLRIKNRNVRVYLPPDYATSGKSYPVIYIQDGSSAFYTGSINSYYFDTTIEGLIAEGRLEGVIAVAIVDSPNRWDEYSPWVNTHVLYVWQLRGQASRLGGEGNGYIDFLVNTLKPEIDTRYRTLSDRENTAIAGGSMGGLISLYGALRNPEIYSKVLAFSPAVWFAEAGGYWLQNNGLINFIKNPGVNPANTDYFIFTGTSEWGYVAAPNLYTAQGNRMLWPWVYREGAEATVNALKKRVPADRIKFITQPGGIHWYSSWRPWIDDALLWFSDEPGEFEPELIDRPELSEIPIGSIITEYEIQISNNSSFTNIVEIAKVGRGELNYSPRTLGSGKYFWRVRSINDLGVKSTWSSVRSIKVDITGPSAPKLLIPFSGVNIRGLPTYYWLPVTEATAYQFEYALTPDFSEIFYQSPTLTVTKHTPPSQETGTYYWHVRAMDSLGNWGAWSDGRPVTIDP